MGSRCPKFYYADFGTKARCELPVRHKGPCGPDRGQPTIPKPHHYQQTSRLALGSIPPGVHGEIEREVFHYLRAGQRTVDEVEVVTGRPHQTVSATVSRLWHDRNLVRPMVTLDGQRIRRKTRNGRLADVYEIVNWPP